MRKDELPICVSSRHVLLFETETTEQIVKRRAADAEYFGRARDVAIGARDDLEHGRALGFVAHLAQVEAREVLIPRLQTQVASPDAVPVDHDHGALDAVLELADVARPRVRLDGRQRILAQDRRPPAVLARKTLHEGMREQYGVTLARAQRRDVDDDLGKPVVEVLAEQAGLDLRLEVAVGRAHDAHLDRNLFAPADALDHALLQEAQQLCLQRHGQVADLVQKQGAAMGGLDLARCLLDRAGEGAFFVAEQFTLEQGVRDGGAVDRDEALTRPRRERVQAAREDLLAGAALAEQGDRHRRGGELLDRAADLEHDPGRG